MKLAKMIGGCSSPGMLLWAMQSCWMRLIFGFLVIWLLIILECSPFSIKELWQLVWEFAIPMCPFLNLLVCKEVLEVEMLLHIDTKLTAEAGSLFLWSLSVHFLICQALMIKRKGHTSKTFYPTTREWLLLTTLLGMQFCGLCFSSGQKEFCSRVAILSLLNGWKRYHGRY